MHKAPGRLSRIQERVVTGFIPDNLHQPVSLSELAAHVSLSRFHFARAFARTFHMPPHQYLLRRRLAAAANMLVTSRKPIGQIAQETGFSSPARLSIAFPPPDGTHAKRVSRDHHLRPDMRSCEGVC